MLIPVLCLPCNHTGLYIHFSFTSLIQKDMAFIIEPTIDEERIVLINNILMQAAYSKLCILFYKAPINFESLFATADKVVQSLSKP